MLRPSFASSMCLAARCDSTYKLAYQVSQRGSGAGPVIRIFGELLERSVGLEVLRRVSGKASFFGSGRSSDEWGNIFLRLRLEEDRELFLLFALRCEKILDRERLCLRREGLKIVQRLLFILSNNFLLCFSGSSAGTHFCNFWKEMRQWFGREKSIFSFEATLFQ